MNEYRSAIHELGHIRALFIPGVKEIRLTAIDRGFWEVTTPAVDDGVDPLKLLSATLAGGIAEGFALGGMCCDDIYESMHGDWRELVSTPMAKFDAMSFETVMYLASDSDRAVMARHLVDCFCDFGEWISEINLEGIQASMNEMLPGDYQLFVPEVVH